MWEWRQRKMDDPETEPDTDSTDTQSDPDPASDDSGTPGEIFYECYACGHSIRREPTEGRVECNACGAHPQAIRARINYLSDNSVLTRLAEGPATTSEVSRSDSDTARPHLEFLDAPNRGGASSTKQRGNGQRASIVYLPGDERAAMRLFIEENTAYIRSCLADQSNPLQRRWPEALWELLLEEWYWLGCGDMTAEGSGDEAAGEDE